MLGAVIGDIVGSRWEFNPTKNKNFPLFSEFNSYTDDSIMTIAVADSLMHDTDPAISMRAWARNVKIRSEITGIGGYGQRFGRWLAAPEVQPPYNSYGNGGAMRVSPAAFLAKTLDEALAMAHKVTIVTHNHPEGLKGALATAHSIFLALQKVQKEEIRTCITGKYHYDLSRSIDEIRPSYEHSEASQSSVPESLICALDATDYEDALRNAVSLGGDADTMAAIAGGLAEAMFGIPEEIKAKGWGYLTEEMKSIINKAYRYRELEISR